MKSTTVHKQSTTSLTSATHTPSEAASHNRHHHSSYRNSSASSRDSLKLKPSDANNNDNSSLLSVTATTTTTATAAITKMPTITAPNRSKNIEKYSLRQRQKRAFAVPSSAAAVAAISVTLKSTALLDNSPSDGSSSRSCFNSGIKRSSTPSAASHSLNAKEKAKSKAAPLSKYRRKTANARERTRMREINSAFENLRRCVPHSITGDESVSANEKLTKITTLRLAMKYIKTLSEALANPSFQEDFLRECRTNGDHRFSTPDWVQSSEAPASRSEEIYSDSSATTQTQSRSKARKTKLQPNKPSTKRQRAKTKIQNTLSPYLDLASSPTYSSSLSSSSSSAYASMSTSPLLNDSHSMTDLSNMILESDGESLHLSEPCLSPLNRSYYLGMQSVDETENTTQSSPVGAAFENPLELSLRLLEPASDSLEFSTDQQPLTCISPLATLETFNPFGDLLHTEFSEHSSLDLFLT